MDLLIYLIVVLAIFAIVWWAISQFSLPPPIRIAAIAIVAVVAIILLLRILPVGGLHGL